MLSASRQLGLAVMSSSTAVVRLRTRSATWLVAYLIAAASILGLVAWLIGRHHAEALEMLMDYVLPEEWQFAARMLIEKLFAQQEQLVVTNLTIVAALLVVQITLFPLKEMVSASLEQDAMLVDEPVEEHPLWFQAWEEAKLFLAMIAAQGTIFWVGYTDDPVRRKVALVLSFAVLFASVAVDFLSPVLQRHKLRYSQILKSLVAHPLLTFGFGALFALPAIGATALAAAHPEWSVTLKLAVAFGGQVLGIALAAIGGTVAGAPLVADARARRRSHVAVRIVAWSVLTGLLAWNAYRFGAIGSSLHHKTQLLKCKYDVDWGTFRPELPGALDLARGLTDDKIMVAASIDVAITNPTSVDVEIEDNRLEVRHAGTLVATSTLPRLDVPAGERRVTKVRLPLTIPPSLIPRVRELATGKGWTITLWLEVADGFDFPIYLLTN